MRNIVRGNLRGNLRGYTDEFGNYWPDIDVNDPYSPYSPVYGTRATEDRDFVPEGMTPSAPGVRPVIYTAAPTSQSGSQSGFDFQKVLPIAALVGIAFVILRG